MSYKSPEEVIAAFHALPLAQQVKVMRLLMEWQYSDDLQHDIHYAIETILKGDTQCPSGGGAFLRLEDLTRSTVTWYSQASRSFFAAREFSRGTWQNGSLYLDQCPTCI